MDHFISVISTVGLIPLPLKTGTHCFLFGILLTGFQTPNCTPSWTGDKRNTRSEWRKVKNGGLRSDHAKASKNIRNAIWPTQCPGHFPTLVNHSLKECLDQFCTSYLDDIVIYCDNLEKHWLHVNMVLHTLCENNVIQKPEKYKIHLQTSTYLGLINYSDGISMDCEGETGEGVAKVR